MATRKTQHAYSRKTGLVTASVNIGEFAICTSVHRTKLDLAVDQFCAASDGAGPLQQLLNDLLLAERDFAKPKPKGIQAGREKIVPILKFAAPWTYCSCESSGNSNRWIVMIACDVLK